MARGGERLARTIGGRIRDHRIRRGWSQGALAEEVGVSTEMISRLERGLSLPSIPTLLALAQALGTSPNLLLGWSDSLSPAELAGLVQIARRLPASRRRDLEQIAETFARYGRRDG